MNDDFFTPGTCLPPAPPRDSCRMVVSVLAASSSIPRAASRRFAAALVAGSGRAVVALAASTSCGYSRRRRCATGLPFLGFSMEAAS